MHGQNKQSNTVNQAVIELLIFWCHVFSVMFTPECALHKIQTHQDSLLYEWYHRASQQVVVTLRGPCVDRNVCVCVCVCVCVMCFDFG